MNLNYEALIAALSRDLEPDEYWMIDHDEGPLWDTASKRMDAPIRVFCEAMDCDWENATESGFRVSKLRKPNPAKPVL